MADTKAERILARWELLKRKRDTLNAEYDDLARLLHPTRIGFQSKVTEGGPRGDDSYDSTAMQARWQLAASTEGFVTPASGDSWMTIAPEDEDLLDDHEVREWFETCTDKTFAAIYDPRSHWRGASNELYNDIVTFGSAVLSMFERYTPDGRVLPVYRAVPLQNSWWAENEHGDRDTFFVLYREPVANFARRYDAKNLSKAMRDTLKDKPDEEAELLHYVGPRMDRDYRRQDNLAMEYESCVLDPKEKLAVEESGFPELPYTAPTWGKVTGEPWGWSPGRLLLPDIKMLNQQAKTTLRVAHQSADPTLLVPHDGVIDWSAVQPGARLTYDLQSAQPFGGRPPIFPLETGANYPISRDITQDTRTRIWEGFLRHVLNLPVDSPQMTATEVIQRKQEMLRLIGPTYGKFDTDLSQPVARRAFWILFRSGAFGPAPEIMRGQKVKFEVNSPLVEVRKQIEATSVVRTLEIIGPIAGLDPSIMDNFDLDEITRGVGAAMMPTDWLRPVDERDAIRKQRAQAQQDAAAREQTMQMAQVARDVAPALKVVEGGAA